MTVIVPARNAVQTISPQLHALIDQAAPETPYEIIVVDNGSTDGTFGVVERIARGDSRIRLLRATTGRGVNVARDVGAQAARGSLLLYCDADDVVDGAWVRELARALLSHHIVGGRIDEHALNSSVDAQYRTPRMTDLPRLEFGAIPFAPGCNMGIRTDVLSAVGGWNVNHPPDIGGDDIDLSWRCQLAGYRIGFAPRAVVHYRYRPSLRSAAAQSYRYGKSLPYTYSRFRDIVWASRGWRTAGTDFLQVLGATPKAITNQQFRRHWVQRSAFLSGRLVGSVRLGVPCL